MPRYSKAFSSFSTNDLEAAKKFYGTVLELKISDKGDIVQLYVGEQEIVIYPKDNHEPATFTVLNFYVPDIEKEVAVLKQKGISFESYDTPDIKTNEQNILIDEEMQMKIAWFKDPAGNILSLIQG